MPKGARKPEERRSKKNGKHRSKEQRMQANAESNVGLPEDFFPLRAGRSGPFGLLGAPGGLESLYNVPGL